MLGCLWTRLYARLCYGEEIEEDQISRQKRPRFGSSDFEILSVVYIVYFCYFFLSLDAS